jgi:cell division inhibitor SulA
MAAPTRTDRNKAAMISALEKHLGNVTTSCRAVGIHHSTHYEWIQKDKKYKDKVISLQEVTKDFAESKLMKLIEGGDTSATIFFLKTRAKDRGYIERTELTGKDGNAMSFKVELTPEQLAQLNKITE